MIDEIKERYEKNKLQTLPLNNKQCKWLIERVEELEKSGMELSHELAKRKTALSIKHTKNKRYKQALEEIESLTRNPKEYEPSIYTLHYISNKALKGVNE